MFVDRCGLGILPHYRLLEKCRELDWGVWLSSQRTCQGSRKSKVKHLGDKEFKVNLSSKGNSKPA